LIDSFFFSRMMGVHFCLAGEIIYGAEGATAPETLRQKDR